jgi:hypothetical protein
MRAHVLFAALMLLPTSSLALDISFFGSPPKQLDARPVTIADDAKPGEPVVFDFKDPASIVVRPAPDDEDASPEHPQYRFEWQSPAKDKARFFPIIAFDALVAIREQNDATSSKTPAGQAKQDAIVMAYLKNGDILRNCMSKQKDMPEAVTVYVTLNPGDAPPSAVVLPEGSIAECVLTATERGKLPQVTSPVTASERFALSRDTGK